MHVVCVYPAQPAVLLFAGLASLLHFGVEALQLDGEKVQVSCSLLNSV